MEALDNQVQGDGQPRLQFGPHVSNKEAFSFELRSIQWMTAAGLLILAGLFVISRFNFLLFHGLAELFAIAVAWSVFLLVWNTRRMVRNDALLYLGIAYLFVGLIDLIHTLAYKGMGVFPNMGADLATQLWIAARGLEALGLLVFPLSFRRRLRIEVVVGGYITVAALLLMSIFVWKVFPTCFSDQTGLTTFKKGAEYTICAVVLMAMVLLYRRRDRIDTDVFRLMMSAMAVTIGAELSFTIYLDVYGLSNIIGHFLKIISFFLVYLALIRSSLTRPYSTLFRELEEEKRQSQLNEAQLRIVTNNLDGLIHAVDQDLRIILSTGRRLTIEGQDPSEMVGKTVFDFFKINYPDHPFVQKYRQALAGDVQRMEMMHEGRQLSTTLSPMKDRQDRIVGVVGLSMDVTEQKQLEHALQRQLAEKEILLRETHHRIKNNLTSIAGLLSLQARSAVHLETQSVLSDAISRVKSMAALYQKMLMSEVYHHVSAAEYLSGLTDSVVSFYAGTIEVNVKKQFDDFKLDPKTLFPLGIILNELLTNTMKYAFEGKATGQVDVSAVKEADRVTLTVRDDGKGLPEGFDIESPTGFGLTLVKMLCRQLDAELSYTSIEGVRWRLEFNLRTQHLE
jgi:PAS domain S-box-containing protein